MREKVTSAGSLLQALTRADHLLSTRLEAALEADGLSIAKFGVLKELANAGEPLPLGQLAERLACVKSNITQLVDRLETDGLVRRVPDLADRRSTLAEITEEGRRRYEVGLKAQSALEQAMVQGLSLDERLQLTSVLEKLARSNDS